MTGLRDESEEIQRNPPTARKRRRRRREK